MKFKPNSKYVTIAFYSLLVIIFGLLFFLCCYNIDAIFDAIGFVFSKTRGVFYGVIFALTLYPLYILCAKFFSKFIEKSRPRRKTVAALSIITTYLAVLLCIAIILLGLVPFIMNDYQILKDAIPGYVERAQSWIENQLDKSSIIKDYYSKILEIFENAFSDLKENFNDYLPQIFGAISSFVGEVSDLVIGVILSIYFLVSRKTISGIINKIFVAILPMSAAQHLSEVIIRLYRNIMAYISTRLIDSFIVGLLCYLFTWIFDIPFFSVLSMLVFLLNIIPVFGPIIGITIATFIVALSDPSKIVILFIILFTLLIVDRYLFEPLLIRKSLRPNIGLTIVILIIGWHLVGFGSALFAIPIYATLAFEFRRLLYYLLRKKGLYEDSKYDVNIPDPSNEYQEQRAMLLTKWNHVVHLLDIYRTNNAEDEDEDSEPTDENK